MRHSQSYRQFRIESLEQRLVLDGVGFLSMGVRSLGTIPWNRENVPPTLTAADLDNDGDRDILVSQARGETQIFLSRGQTTISEPDIEMRTRGSASVADVNGDGYRDIITKNDTSLDVWIHNGSEQQIEFANPVRTELTTGVPAFSALDRVHFEDVNGDGRDDLLFGIWNTGVEVRLSLGDGTFDDGILFATSAAFTTTDVNEDGFPDLVVGKDFETEQVYLNDGEGLFEFANESEWKFILPNIDIDGDGFDDRAGFREFDEVEFIVSLGLGDATWEPYRVTYKAEFGAYVSSRFVDLNADGKLDFIFSSPAAWHDTTLDSLSGGTSIMFQTERGEFTDPIRISSAIGSLAIGTDMVAISAEGVIEFIELKSPTFNSGSILDFRPGQFEQAEQGVRILPVTTDFIDANEDGRLDIVRERSELVQASLFLNDGDQVFRSESEFFVKEYESINQRIDQQSPSIAFSDLPQPPSQLATWRTHGLSDFNSDGEQDIVLIDSSKSIGRLRYDGTPNDWNAELSVWYRQPNGELEQRLRQPGVGYAFDVTDLNSDENPDLVAVMHQTSSQPGELVIWHGTSEGFVEEKRLPAPAEVSFVRSLDLNGDGVKDFALGSLDRKLTLMLSTETGDYVEESYDVDQLVDDVFYGDFDLDGNADLLITEFGTRFRPGGRCFICEGRISLSPNVWLSVLPGTPDGRLAAPEQKTAIRAFSINTMSVEDLDGDSDLDIVLGGDHLAVVWNQAAVQPRITLADIHLQCEAIRSEEHRDEFDRNDDSLVDVADLDELLRMEGNTRRGDADLNGRVEFADFLQLSTNVGSVDAAWEDGDFDCDGSVTFADFLVLSSTFGFSQ